MTGRHRLRALLPAALLLAAPLGLAACSNDDDAATESTTKQAEEQVEDAQPAQGTATFTTDRGVDEDLELTTCVADQEGVLQVSGSSGDSTLDVAIDATSSSVQWDGEEGTVTELTVEPATREFQLTGLLTGQDGQPAADAPSYTLAGRCPEG